MSSFARKDILLGDAGAERYFINQNSRKNQKRNGRSLLKKMCGGLEVVFFCFSLFVNIIIKIACEPHFVTWFLQ